MAFRMPSGAKKALMKMGISGKDYKIIRNNMKELWEPNSPYNITSYDMNSYVARFVSDDGSFKYSKLADNWGIFDGTEFSKKINSQKTISETSERASSSADNLKLLPQGKGDLNNNPVQQIVKQQNAKSPLLSGKSEATVNNQFSIHGDDADAISSGIINEGGTSPGTGNINYITGSRSAGIDGGIVNDTIPANGPQGVANAKVAAENGTGGTINAGGTPKDAGPNGINHTTAAPTSNPGPDGISFDSPSGGGTGTINGGVSTNSDTIASGGVSNTQISFGDGAKQSGPSVNPKKTGPAYDFKQFQGKYRPSSGGKMNAAEEYMTKNRWDEINDDWARAQEAKKAGNTEEYNSIIDRYGGATSRRGFQDHMLGNMQKSGPGVMDYVWGYKMPQTVVGAGLIFGLGSEIVGANNGQKSNAELYSTPM